MIQEPITNRRSLKLITGLRLNICSTCNPDSFSRWLIGNYYPSFHFFYITKWLLKPQLSPRVLFHFQLQRNQEKDWELPCHYIFVVIAKTDIYLEFGKSNSYIKSRHVLVAIFQSEALFTGTKLDGQTPRKSRELKIEKRFERRTSTGSGRFAFLGCGFVQIVLGKPFQ